MDISKLKIGDKVRYQPSHYTDDEWENGMIKEIPSGATCKESVTYNCVRVVYNCGGNWDDFKSYTSALTSLGDLKPGWRHE